MAKKDKSVNENKVNTKGKSLELESSRYREDESDRMSDGMVP